MASAREPRTGMKPMAEPIRRSDPRLSTALAKAPMGPERVALPKDISPITPVSPMMTTNRKYGRRNVPPPYFETLVGNIHILPMPTAEPMQARMKPHLDFQESRCG